MKALSIPTPSDLESLVTTAIYNSLITARLSPATNPPTVHVTSVAPLRDIRPDTVSTMISILSEWEGRCGDVINGIEAEIARIKAQAEKNRARERERAAILEKSIAGWDGDDDGADTTTTPTATGRPGTSGSSSSKFNLRGSGSTKDGGGAANNKSKSGGAGGGGNKREFNADDDLDDDDGYWDNGSDGALDSSGPAGSRMDIDEGAGAASSSRASTTRQAKRILNMGKKH